MGAPPPPPHYRAPDCDRASQQILADNLGRSESNGVRVDLFMPTIDLPGHIKQKNYRFPGWCFSLMAYLPFWIESLFCHHRVSLVKADRFICLMTPKGHLLTLTSGHPRSRSHIYVNSSCRISLAASWRDEHLRTNPMSIFFQSFTFTFTAHGFCFFVLLRS